MLAKQSLFCNCDQVAVDCDDLTLASFPIITGKWKKSGMSLPISQRNKKASTPWLLGGGFYLILIVASIKC